jgi:hypothetical protein
MTHLRHRATPYNDMALLAWRGPGYLAQDAAVSGRDLFWYKPQPDGEVATFGEAIAGGRH